MNLLKKIDKYVIVDNYKLKQTFKSYNGGTKILYDKQIVSVVSVLRFIFSYFDKYDNYAILALDIEKEILSDKNAKVANTVKSSLDIYKIVANT